MQQNIYLYLNPVKPKISKKNLHLVNILSTTGKLLERVILKIVQGNIEERGRLNASQFAFHASHSTALHHGHRHRRHHHHHHHHHHHYLFP
jgi:hypothetical protein